MSDIWAPVVAALGSAFLTGMFTTGVAWWQSRQSSKSTLAERRSRAYSMLLARSASIIHIAHNFHLTMEFRSGLREGFNNLLGTYKPLDPLDLGARMNAEFQPLYEAWSEVWVSGSKDAIAEANDLLACCADVMGAATQHGQATPTWLRAIAGEKWSKQQLDQWQEEVRKLAASRRRFGGIARKELGIELADLFASNVEDSSRQH